MFSGKRHKATGYLKTARLVFRQPDAAQKPRLRAAQAGERKNSDFSDSPTNLLRAT